MTEFEFNNFLITFRPSMYRFAMSLTRNREDTLDLIQDTCIKAIKNHKTIPHHDNLKSWVLTIMKNTFINNYRAARLRDQILVSAPDLAILEKYFTKQAVTIESQIAEKDIKSAINSLNYKFQVPIKMFMHGYKYEEIADQLNINLGTIKSRIFMARKQLQAILS